MMKIILSSGNIISASPVSLNHPSTQKSNAEFVHSLRLNIEESKHSALPSPNGHAAENGNTANGTSHKRGHDWKRWTDMQDDGQTLYVPAIDFTESGLHEERAQYDITVKLFYLRSTSASQREEQTRRALDLVLKELHVPSVSLLIVSFPGIYFDEATEECPDKIKSRGPVEVTPESLELQVETWKVLEKLHDEGLVERLGVAEFGEERLNTILDKSRLSPAVDQINLRDCCGTPKSLLGLAKAKGIELLVHNDCTNILPRGTVREILGQREGGAGILADEATTGEKRKQHHDDNVSPGLRGEVLPQWVVKYTAVVSNRGVVENKGYFALAEVTS